MLYGRIYREFVDKAVQRVSRELGKCNSASEAQAEREREWLAEKALWREDRRETGRNGIACAGRPCAKQQVRSQRLLTATALTPAFSPLTTNLACSGRPAIGRPKVAVTLEQSPRTGLRTCRLVEVATSSECLLVQRATYHRPLLHPCSSRSSGDTRDTYPMIASTRTLKHIRHR